MSTNETGLVKSEKTVQDHLESDAFKAKIETALPSHLTPDRFIGVALNALNKTPALANCTQKSLFKCFLELSEMGLEPDGRRAHLIPFGKECTLLIDYKGLVELALRNGDVARIHADVVYEREYDAGDFIYDRGRIERHRKSLMPERGKVIAAYAEVEFKSGAAKAEVMSVEEIEGIRSRSKSGKNGPWVTDWNEMAKKTAFRRLSKWLPLSPEIREHIEKDDEHQFSNMKRAKTPAPAQPMFRKLDNETADEVVSEVAEGQEVKA